MSYICLVSHKETSYLHSHPHYCICRDCSIGFCYSRRMVLVDIHRGTVLTTYCDGLFDTLFPDPYVRDLQTMERSNRTFVGRPVVCRRRRRTEAGGFE